MIDNFSSIKWIFHELEDLKEKFDQSDVHVSGSDQDSLGDQVGHITRVENRLQSLEAFNQNHTSHMLDTLATLNENIISLGESLKAVGMGGVKEDKDKSEPMQTNADREATKELVGQQEDQKQESKATETQRDIEATKTMHELEGQIDQ